MKGIFLAGNGRDNNIDQALRVLKKKMQREGVFREMKRRRFYEKPISGSPQNHRAALSVRMNRTAPGVFDFEQVWSAKRW